MGGDYWFSWQGWEVAIIAMVCEPKRPTGSTFGCFAAANCSHDAILMAFRRGLEAQGGDVASRS